METRSVRKSGEVRFDGRAILVTGSGRGMGRTHALLLASRGASVIVADNGASTDGETQNTSPAQTVVSEIEAAGGKAVSCTADLSTEAGAEAAVATSINTFGRIDAILHNASTIPQPATPDHISSRDLDLVMRINPYAGLWLARAAWPHMQHQRYGRILLTSSHSVYGAEMTAAYCAAKSAVIGAMRSLAIDGAEDGILVNVLLPTARTRMTEGMPRSEYTDWLFERMLPERVSCGATFLLSEECSISGEMFSMTGGRIARVVLGENEGCIGSGDSIEEVREMMDVIMSNRSFFYPETYTERSYKVANAMGYTGKINNLVKK